jgi:hypothetical protein
MPDLKPGYNLIRRRGEAVIPGRAQARTRNLEMIRIDNPGIPDPALRAGPE